jgi:Concanavalin A-like lectin/glucanases superfamily
MTDEVRSMSLGASATAGGIVGLQVTQPFGEPLRTLAVGHELDSDTFALWRMNETEYQTALILNSAQSAKAAYSQRSVTFGGTDEYVTMGNVLAFEYDEAFSISVWFKTATNGYIVSKMAGTPQGYGGYIGGSGELILYITGSGTNSLSVQTTATGFDDGEWHHAVFCYSGSGAASGVTLYVDGSAEAMTTLTDNLSSTSIVSTTPFTISGRTDGGAYLFVGPLDETVVFSKELSSTEVTALYNNGVPTSPFGVTTAAGFVAGYWRMGDGDTYPTLTDHSSGGNDGTMTAMESTDITREVPAGYTLVPSTPSNWASTPPISYGPGGKKQACRWFRGSGSSSNFIHPANSDMVATLTGDFTVELWVYMEDLSIGEQIVFMYSTAGETEATNGLIQITTATDGKIGLFWEYGSGVNVGFTTASAYLTNRTWHHLTVACVVATGTRTAKIYVDGDFKESTSGTNASGGTSSTLFIGYSGSDRPFYGGMADIRLSDKERTSTEIAVSAAASDFKHLLDVDTFALWRLDDRPAIEDEMGVVPLNPSSFTTDPVIVAPLINDNGKARLLDDDRDAWFPKRTLLRDTFLADVTFEAWFKVNDKDGSSAGFSPDSMFMLTYAGNWSLDTEAENFLFRALFSASKLALTWEAGAGTNVDVLTTDNPIASTDWWSRHHIAITRAVGATSTVKFYLDGVLLEESTGNTNASGCTSNGVIFSMGFASGGTDTPFVLDDVRLSSKIRTAGEIARSFARGTPVDKITRYRKRARDSGSAGTVYVTWETTDPDGAFPGTIPGGGPLVDEVTLDEFQV